MNIRNLGHDKWELMFFMALSMTTFLLISSISTAYAGPVERDQAKRIHDRLTGVPPTNADLNAMEAEILTGGGPVEAARYAMDPTRNSRAKYFYNVTLKNWVTPWTNEEQTMFAPLNDYTALVIGMIRDNKDFSRVLTDDILYIGDVAAIQTDEGKTITGFASNSNQHYEDLESNDIDLSNDTHLIETTQSGRGMAGGHAGIVSTRAAGQAFFKDGTNRAMFRFTLMNHLCRDLEDVKDVTRVPDRIRQDVSRSPGGDSSIFLNSCIGCHAGMDPLAQAYAYYEWNDTAGVVEYTFGNVQAKYHINSTNFEHGYRTPDESWINYWRQGPNANLGWANNSPDPVVTSGTGAAEMGLELTGTDAFAQCQVEKVYKQVCLQDPIESHASNISTITVEFKSGYNMKEVFAKVAALCMGN